MVAGPNTYVQHEAMMPEWGCQISESDQYKGLSYDGFDGFAGRRGGGSGQWGRVVCRELERRKRVRLGGLRLFVCDWGEPLYHDGLALLRRTGASAASRGRLAVRWGREGSDLSFEIPNLTLSPTVATGPENFLKTASRLEKRCWLVQLGGGPSWNWKLEFFVNAGCG